MNIQPKNKKGRKRTAVIVVVLLIVIAIAVFFAWNHLRETPYTSPVLDKSNQQKNTDPENASKDTQKVGTEDNPVRDTPDSEKITAQLNIPSHQVNKNSVLLNIAINKPWPSTATCVISITGPTVISRSEPVFAQAQISGCQFNISDLKSGDYTLTIFAKNGQEKTNTETVNITIPQ